MKTLILPILFAAALPSAAQEKLQVALSYDVQSPRAQTYEPTTFSPVQNSAPGLAFAWTGWTSGKAELSLTAALRFKGKSDLKVDGERVGRFTSEHQALGAALTWRQVVDLGLGLQVRFEKQALVPLEEGDTWSARQTRPWLTASAGHSFQAAGRVKPFVALVAALPLTSQSKPTGIATTEAEAVANQEKLVKSMAPKFEVAVQVGLRF